jgi:DHA1 family tetracycline resistance protein-like MFS transporter
MQTTLSPRKPAIGFIFITMVLTVLGFGLLIPVLPGLVTEFKGGDVSEGSHTYGLLIGIFSLIQFIGAPILGTLSDQFGRRKVILLSLAGASIDYVIMALAPNLTWLFIARMIAGFTAGVLATANAYVADITTPENRAHNFGLLGAAFGIGFVFGPVAGGLLGSINLRLPFWFAAVFAACNFMYGFFVLPESLAPENRKPFDWKRANPLSALRSLKRFPSVKGMAGAYFLVMLGQALLFSTWVLYLGYRYDWGTRTVGITLGLAGILAALVQALLVKHIVPRLGDARSILVSYCVIMTAYAAYGLATQGWMVYAIMLVSSLGQICAPATQSYITKHIPANEQGMVQGILSGLASLASIPGVLIGTWSFGWAVSPGAPWHLPGLPLFEGSLCMAIALVLALRTFKGEKTQLHESAPSQERPR